MHPQEVIDKIEEIINKIRQTSCGSRDAIYFTHGKQIIDTLIAQFKNHPENKRAIPVTTQPQTEIAPSHSQMNNLPKNRP